MTEFSQDIVYFVDPRFPGGSSTAVAAELAALAQSQIVPGFCTVLSCLFPSPRPLHPKLYAHFKAGHVTFVDPTCPGHAKVALVHHPQLFSNLPPVQLRLRCDKVVLVLHHPPFDAFGQPEYDLEHVLANLIEVFGCEILMAPVGPVVRRQINDHPIKGARLLAEDWHGMIDYDSWPLRPQRKQEPMVIGRHSRPHLTKFPDSLTEALQVYPESPGRKVRMLGAGDDLIAHYGRFPANWELIPFGSISVPAFLHSLDLYVYFTSRKWVEAFGFAILEAAAAGVPVITSPDLEPLFGKAALYREPRDVEALLTSLQANPSRIAEQATVARNYVKEAFSLDQFLPRLRRLGVSPKAQPPAIHPSLRVVMMTSNGVGLGHLTRLLAIARRLPEETETSFFTLSQGFKHAEDAGYLTQFVPFHGVTGASSESWNTALAEELGDFLDLTRPDVLCFDGSTPYTGMLSALDQRPWIRRVWVRRTLWHSSKNVHVTRSNVFDLVLQPLEISGRFDRGATSQGNDAITVAPILNVGSDERLSRDEALAELGLSSAATEGRTVVGLMLGAGTNFDLEGIRAAILADLCRRDVTVIEIVATLAQRKPAPHRQISLYPAYRISRAFDFMISGAGYNAFHEALIGGVPTVFVPNEAPEMDLQLLRARHAQVIGCAEILRARDRIGVARVLDRMMELNERAAMVAKMDRFKMDSGATEAARLIMQFARALRLQANTLIERQ